MKYVLAVLIVLALPLGGQAVTIDLVSVGNPGNAAEVNGGNLFGSVSHSYQIGKTEVTNAQYVDFLNAKAATDTVNLYNPNMGAHLDGGIVRSGAAGSYAYTVKATAVGVGPGGTDYTYGDKPVNYVSWYDAIRFANWMNNGQGSGNTETGAYTITGGSTPSNPNSIMRNGGATWFLPNEDEWYKAAYYKPTDSTYSDFSNSTDTTPNNNLPSGDTGNSANFLVGSVTTTGDISYPLTSAGAYSLSESWYHTRDQGGNVAEWNEFLDSATGKRGRRGGGWNTTAASLSSATRELVVPGTENQSTGFRLANITAVVASVPGDYNNNGIVDAADYVVWRAHLGASFQLQNEVTGTSPGTVDQDDYTAWRARFGNTSGAGAGSELGTASVPEPLAAVLLATSAILGGLVRRQSRRIG